MKKLGKVLGILGVTAITLTACDNQGGTTASTTADEGNVAEVSISDLKVAYIHTDSVINNFEFFKERSEEIASKGKKYDSELSNRAKGFEQEVVNFQQTANSMTVNQQRAKQDELVSKERNLVTYRDNLMQELAADESKLYNDVYDQIQDYLNTYAEENNLEMILSYTRGGGVWYAKNSLDVTNSVIEGINEKYRGKKQTAEKK